MRDRAMRQESWRRGLEIYPAMAAAEPNAAAPSGRLSGTVTVLRGAYREPLAVVGGLLAAMRARHARSARPRPVRANVSRPARSSGVSTMTVFACGMRHNIIYIYLVQAT